MSCSINRYKFVGNTGAKPTANTESAALMSARLSELMAIRSSQDNGDFKQRSSWIPANATANAFAPASATDDAVFPHPTPQKN